MGDSSGSKSDRLTESLGASAKKRARDKAARKEAECQEREKAAKDKLDKEQREKEERAGRMDARNVQDLQRQLQDLQEQLKTSRKETADSRKETAESHGRENWLQEDNAKLRGMVGKGAAGGTPPTTTPPSSSGTDISALIAALSTALSRTHTTNRDDEFSSRQKPPKLDIELMKNRDFDIWQLQWEDFEAISGLDKKNEQVRLRQLRLAMDPTTILKISRLSFRDGEADTVEGLIRAIGNLIREKTNPVIERLIFRERKQHHNETVGDFYISLQSLAKDCSFCDQCFDENIKDSMLLGMSSRFVREEISKMEKVYEMSMERFLDHARRLEQTEQARERIASKDYTAIETAAVAMTKKSNYKKAKDMAGMSAVGVDMSKKLPPKEKKPDTKSTGSDRCRWCAKSASHPRAKCPAKSSRCNGCDRLGHWACACLSGKTRPAEKSNMLAIGHEDSDTLSVDLVRVEVNALKVAAKDRLKPVYCELRYQNTVMADIPLIPDCGSEITVINSSLFRKLGGHEEDLEACEYRVKQADGSPAQVKGTANISVILNDCRVNSVPVVVFEKGSPLISLSLCKALGLIHKDFPFHLGEKKKAGEKQDEELLEIHITEADVVDKTAGSDNDRSTHYSPTSSPAPSLDSGKNSSDSDNPLATADECLEQFLLAEDQNKLREEKRQLEEAQKLETKEIGDKMVAVAEQRLKEQGKLPCQGPLTYAEMAAKPSSQPVARVKPITRQVSPMRGVAYGRAAARGRSSTTNSSRGRMAERPFRWDIPPSDTNRRMRNATTAQEAHRGRVPSSRGWSTAATTSFLDPNVTPAEHPARARMRPDSLPRRRSSPEVITLDEEEPTTTGKKEVRKTAKQDREMVDSEKAERRNKNRPKPRHISEPNSVPVASRPVEPGQFDNAGSDVTPEPAHRETGTRDPELNSDGRGAVEKTKRYPDGSRTVRPADEFGEYDITEPGRGSKAPETQVMHRQNEGDKYYVETCEGQLMVRHRDKLRERTQASLPEGVTDAYQRYWQLRRDLGAASPEPMDTTGPANTPDRKVVLQTPDDASSDSSPQPRRSKRIRDRPANALDNTSTDTGDSTPAKKVMKLSLKDESGTKPKEIKSWLERMATQQEADRQQQRKERLRVQRKLLRKAIQKIERKQRRKEGKRDRTGDSSESDSDSHSKKKFKAKRRN